MRAGSITMLRAAGVAAPAALLLAFAPPGKAPTLSSPYIFQAAKIGAPLLAEHSNASYGDLPLAFESNEGQTDKQVLYLSHGPGYALFLTPQEAVLSLQSGSVLNSHRHHHVPPVRVAANRTADIPATSVIRIRLANANRHPQVTGVSPLPGKSNYFIGNNPSKWRTGVSNYARVQYKDVYPGIDLVYYGNHRQLEYDWVVSPGADLHRISLDISGARRAQLAADGNLQIETAAGNIIQHAPVVYQEIDGQRRTVVGRLALNTTPDRNSGSAVARIGFDVEEYDHSRPLIIDPVIAYSTYIGGSQFDSASGIALDSYGNAYITGSSNSANYPVVGAYQSTNKANTVEGYDNAFVTKINAAGTAIVYSTYLGGKTEDEANGIGVDSSGDAYVGGLTESTNFPVVNALYHTLPSSNGAGFVTKLNPAGSALLYSTFLGGSSGAEITAIAVQPNGNAYVTGGTGSTNFPTKNAVQSVNNGHGVLGDGTIFITEFNPTGSALVFSTYYGGSGGDTGNAIAVDASGYVYVTGDSNSTNFPVHNAFQGSARGEGDAFVLKLTPNGLAVTYASYLGGSLIDHAHCIACDSLGDAYVGGDTNSLNFQTKNAYQGSNRNPGGVSTGWVTKVSSSGGLVWSTYLGGTGDDIGNGESVDGIAVDSADEVYVTGSSSSPNYPVVNATQTANGGSGNAFVTKFSSAGSALLFSTFLGGTGGDVGLGIALDSLGNAFVTGETRSTNFPTVNPLQAMTHTQLAGNAFITRYNLANTWLASDVAAGSDDKGHLLLHNQTGEMKLWAVAQNGSYTAGTVYGPYAGYTVQAVTAGADGYTRVLWTSTTGSAMLWFYNSSGGFIKRYTFTPAANEGWTALDIAVGTDNNTRILWADTAGSISVWSISSTGVATEGTTYAPPAAGWTARSISGYPAGDGYLRVTWIYNGTLQIWLMNLNDTKYSALTVEADAGWSPIDVSGAIDKTTRVLWVNSTGQAVMWAVTDAGVITKGTIFGPVTGLSATRLAAGPDGYTRVLWFNNNGAFEVQLLNPSLTQYNDYTFGPF